MRGNREIKSRNQSKYVTEKRQKKDEGGFSSHDLDLVLWRAGVKHELRTTLCSRSRSFFAVAMVRRRKVDPTL